MLSQIAQGNKTGPNGNDYMGGPPTGSQQNILNSEKIEEYMKKQQTDQTVKSPQSRSLRFRSILSFSEPCPFHVYFQAEACGRYHHQTTDVIRTTDGWQEGDIIYSINPLEEYEAEVLVMYVILP